MNDVNKQTNKLMAFVSILLLSLLILSGCGGTAVADEPQEQPLTSQAVIDLLEEGGGFGLYFEEMGFHLSRVVPDSRQIEDVSFYGGEGYELVIILTYYENADKMNAGDLEDLLSEDPHRNLFNQLALTLQERLEAPHFFVTVRYEDAQNNLYALESFSAERRYEEEETEERSLREEGNLRGLAWFIENETVRIMELKEFLIEAMAEVPLSDLNILPYSTNEMLIEFRRTEEEDWDFHRAPTFEELNIIMDEFWEELDSIQDDLYQLAEFLGEHVNALEFFVIVRYVDYTGELLIAEDTFAAAASW